MLEDWQHYKKITISGSSGAGTGYQKDLKVGESSGASGYDFHLEGNSANFPSGKNDGGDLRFTSSDGQTLLPFWVEEVEGTSPNRTAKIWVRVADNLDSEVDVFCYYGNSSASNVSNGDSTFEFFDDFEGTSLDTSKWTIVGDGSVSVANGLCTITSNGEHDGIIGKTSFGQEYSIRARSRTTTYENGHSWGGWADTGDASQNSTRVIYGGSGCAYNVYKDGSASYRHSITLDTNFHIIKIARVSDTKLIFDHDDGGDTYTETNTSYIPTVAMYPHFTNWIANITTEVDFIFVRKYTDPEPSFSSAGEEQNTTSSSNSILFAMNF